MNNKARIFLVDDHEPLREIVTECLKKHDYEVIAATDSKGLFQSLPSADPDIILLDLQLPDADGLTLISKIREYTDVPVIIISSRNEASDRIVGLEMGADDYVGKPFNLQELSSRIKAQLRRYHSMQDTARGAVSGKDRVRFGSWVLDRQRVQVYNAQGASCNLTAKEFRILESFILAPNCVLSREQILNKTDPENFDITDRAVDVQILRIRRKIGDASNNDQEQMIKTIRGVGYMLVADVRSAD